MATSSPPRTARQRARIELTREIKEAARRHLAAHGAPALSLRAIAREVGLVSASALYRYFDSRDALLTALIIDAYQGLGEEAAAAERAVHHRDVHTRWVAICHGVRGWARSHPHEYALIYGSPVPGYAAPQDTVEPGTQVPMLLGSLLAELMTTGGEGAASEHPPVPPNVRSALAPVLATMPPGVPADLMIRGLIAWTYLFGAVSMEVFGHQQAVGDDNDAIFDYEIKRLGTLLGLAG